MIYIPKEIVSLDVLRRLGERECCCHGVPTVKRGNYRLKDLKRKLAVASQVSCETRKMICPVHCTERSVWKLQKTRSGIEDTTGKGGQGAETPRLAGTVFEHQGTEDSRIT